MDGKVKVSFGIKTSKQSTITKKTPEISNDIEYISSFDSSCKPLGFEKPKEDLVIPTQANKIGKEFLEDLKAQQNHSSTDNGNLNQSLDQQAEKELIEEAKGEGKNEVNKKLSVPLLYKESDASEATLEDYDNIPIQDFGKAMLRGMGWAPGMGIGKNQRIVAPSVPQLRPKGMGLGADKLAATNPGPPSSSRTDKEELNLAVGSCTQVVAGCHKDMYGKIVSHNEDTGRCIIKLEIGGSSVSVNENLLKAVTTEEYSNNARVLNAAKYKKYKDSSDANLQRRGEEFSRNNWDNSPEMRKSPSEARRRRNRSRSPV